MAVPRPREFGTCRPRGVQRPSRHQANAKRASRAASAKSPETAGDLTIHWVSSYYPDPDNWIGQMYDSQNWGSWKALSYYKSEAMDKVLAEARQETSQQKRDALYQRASRMAVDEAIDVYIYNTVLQRGISKRLRGYQYCPVGDGLEIWPLYFA